jgi:hypothetical protein
VHQHSSCAVLARDPDKAANGSAVKLPSAQRSVDDAAQPMLEAANAEFLISWW